MDMLLHRCLIRAVLLSFLASIDANDHATLAPRLICIFPKRFSDRLHVRSSGHSRHQRPASTPDRLAASQVHQRDQEFEGAECLETSLLRRH
jgi:hypothetical protein